MPKPREYVQHPATSSDIPLPGMMSCLTMQLNITRYRSPSTYRWVLSTREPVDNIEVYRAFGAVDDWSGPLQIAGMLTELHQGLYNMDYMLGATGH